MPGFDNTNNQFQQQTGANGLNANDVYSPPPQQQVAQAPWRPTYGQVAPAYGDGNTGSNIGDPNANGNGNGVTYEGGVPVAPRPVQNPGYNQAPYNQAPTDAGTVNGGNGTAYNPGGGAAYNPGGGAAYNPGDQQVPQQAPALGDNGQSGPVWNQQNPRQQASSLNDTSYDSQPVVKPIGWFAGGLVGGVGGVLGGTVIPKLGNRLADNILESKAAGVEGAKPGYFEQGGSGRNLFGDKFADQAQARVNQFSEKAGEMNGGRMERLATGWQNNMDFRFQNRPDLTKLFNENNTALTDFKAANTGELTAEQAATKARLEARQNVLAVGEGTAAKLNPNLFTKEGQAALNGLKESADFTQAERGLLNSQANNLGKAFANTKEMKPLERPIAGDFVKGAALIGGSLLADQMAGNILGKDGAMHLDSVALPLAWSAPGSFKERAIYSAAAIVGSKTIDALLPAQDHKEINRIFAPNAGDALTMGAAFALPVPDAKLRMGMVGGAWAFGRLRNMNDTESLISTGAIAAGTGWAMKVGKINPRLGAGLLAAEGGAWLLSRVFRGNDGK